MGARKIAVRNSPIHGRGVFALRRIARGEEIIRYKGALRTHEDVDAEHDTDTGHTFLFTLNERYVIDAGRGGNSARWINHSCQPNCKAWWIESDSGDPRHDRVVIEARRDIAPGEELTYDYGIDPGEPLTAAVKKLWRCGCGSRRCRGTMLKT
jgi:uncharacterized protein